MSLESPTRIAISHSILFSLLLYTFVAIAVSIDKKHDRNYEVTRRVLLATTVLFAYPLLLSFVLLYGILKKKLTFVRAWLISSMIATVILLFALLSGAVFVAVKLEVYFGVILCLTPFVLAFWMAEGIIVVLSYYKREESKLLEIEPV